MLPEQIAVCARDRSAPRSAASGTGRGCQARTPRWAHSGKQAHESSAPRGGCRGHLGGAARHRRSRPSSSHISSGRWPIGSIATAIKKEALQETAARSPSYEGIVLRQDQRQIQHVLAEQGHPGGAVGLFEVDRRSAAVRYDRTRRYCRAPRNPPSKHVVARSDSLRFTHPREVQHQLGELLLEESSGRSVRSPIAMFGPVDHQRGRTHAPAGFHVR